MSWTYDPTQLSTNEVYAVRLEIGDVDPQNQQLADEEITYAIGQERNLWAASARCCEMIYRVVLRKADVRLGRNMQVIYTKMAQQYLDMARALRCKAMGTVVPYVGGMNVADKQTIADNDSLVAPAFTREMQQNPWTGGYTSDSLGPTESGEDDSGAEF